MALALASLHKNLVRQFSSTPSDSRFQKDFVDAVNLGTDQLSCAASLTTNIAHISSYNDSISELDSTDLNILEPVVVFNLVNAGRKHVRGDDAYNKQLDRYEEALADYQVQESISTQADIDTDGTGAHYAGLGDVTDSDY